MNDKKDFNELYNDDKLVYQMIKKSVDQVIDNFKYWKKTSPYDNTNDNEDDSYTIVNIYSNNSKQLTLVCMFGKIILDYCFTDYIEEKRFISLIEIILSEETIIDEVYKNIFDKYQDITNYNIDLENCNICDYPFHLKNKHGNIINNVCETCEPSLFLSMKAYSNTECNICFTKVLEKIKKEKKETLYNFKTLYNITCCKEKIICRDCFTRLKKSCICFYQLVCSNKQCPFCKQCLRLSKIY